MCYLHHLSPSFCLTVYFPVLSESNCHDIHRPSCIHLYLCCLCSVFPCWIVVHRLKYVTLEASSLHLFYMHADGCIAGSAANNEMVVGYIGGSVHYDLVTHEGIEQWSKLIPDTGYVVRQGSDNQSDAPILFTVGLFHELKCLDILRSEYVNRYLNSSIRATKPSSTAKDCLNYLRQVIICNMDMGLENVKDDFGRVTKGHEVICQDWTKVYERYGGEQWVTRKS
jgi:hypothetical protein